MSDRIRHVETAHSILSAIINGEDLPEGVVMYAKGVALIDVSSRLEALKMVDCFSPDEKKKIAECQEVVESMVKKIGGIDGQE